VTEEQQKKAIELLQECYRRDHDAPPYEGIDMDLEIGEFLQEIGAEEHV
jgi:hypothetical protein